MRQSSQPAATHVAVGEALTRHIAALAAAGQIRGLPDPPIDGGPAVVRGAMRNVLQRRLIAFTAGSMRSSIKLNLEDDIGTFALVVPVKAERNLPMVSDAEVVA